MDDERLQRYAAELFAVEDPILARVRARHAERELPPIHISPEEGKLLHVLVRLVAARRVLEIGSLAGYSGIWLARALPADGLLTTLEIDPHHAGLARQAYDEADIADRVRLLQGDARNILPTLQPGFDVVFIDADKEPLPEYFEWSVRLLRSGGLLLCDNAFLHGSVVEADNDAPATEGVRAFNRLAASDPRVVSAIVPLRDGIVVAVKVGT